MFSVVGALTFSDSNQTNFDSGTYSNTYWNGSGVVLFGNNLTGIYTSQVFDSGFDSTWNNLSWVGDEPEKEFLFCVDGGGEIYRSSDLGISWSVSQMDFGRTSATTDMFSDNNYLYILSSSGNEVWRSSDGTNFSVVYNDFESKSPYVGNVDKFVSNSNLYVATGTGEVWKSSDSGINWLKVGDFNPGTQTPKGIAINQYGHIFAVDGTGSVYRSVDDGSNWVEMTSGYGGGTATDGMESDSNGNLYILLDKKVYKSENNGTTWNIINDSFTSYTHNGLRIIVDQIDTLFIVDSVGRIFRSDNLGVSWIELGDCNLGASNDILGLTDFFSKNNLSFEVRSCDVVDCSDSSFSIQNLTELNIDGRYFQYRVLFNSQVSGATAMVSSVEIDYTLPPEEVYVDDDFNFLTSGFGVVNFSNISDALVAVRDGGSVYVASGSYSESFVISKSVNLVGESYLNTSIVGLGSGNVVMINSDYVNISGFNITGSGSNWGNSGVYFNSVGYSHFTRNHISGNRVGMSLIGSGNNQIYSNYFVSSTEYGIYTNNWATSGNYIYNNYFDNSNNFYAASQNPANYFNVTKTLGENIVGGDYLGGNFWNSYSGTNRGDGFGDTAHNVYGVYYDYLPLVDNSAPVVEIFSPQDGNAYGYNESLELNFSAYDPDDNLDSCWYSLNGGVDIILSNCQNTTIDVPEGNNNLVVYANDTSGIESSDSVSFSVAVGAPSIVLNSLPNGTYLNYSENIYFNYTATDIDLDSCELWGDFDGDFKVNQSKSSISGIQDSFVLNLSDGKYFWNVRCNDTAGNSAFNGNQTFYVDTTKPQITLTQPIGKKTSRHVELVWSVFDSNLNSCWYNVYRGSNLEISNTSTNCNLGSGAFDVTLDADFVLNFYVSDLAGNVNSSNVSFSVDTSTPVTPPISGGGGGGGGGSVIAGSSGLGLSLSGVSDLVARAGDKKSLSLVVKNNGIRFVNSCVLRGSGDYSSWISSSGLKNIGGGESTSYSFELSVPSNVNSGSHEVILEIECDEGKQSTSFDVSVLEEKIIFDIKEVKRDTRERVRIIYSLKESSGIEQNVEVQFLLFDSGNNKVTEFTEIKKVSANSENEFTTYLEIDSSVRGEMNLLVNLNSETYSSFVQENIILGAPISGLAIFSNVEDTDTIISWVIIVLFFVFAIFMTLRILKLRKHSHRVRKYKISSGGYLKHLLHLKK